MLLEAGVANPVGPKRDHVLPAYSTLFLLLLVPCSKGANLNFTPVDCSGRKTTGRGPNLVLLFPFFPRPQLYLLALALPSQ